METTDKALRYDGGKVRHDLVSPTAINELAKVLTFGASKYAPNNWRKGMMWSRVIGSLERHLNAIKKGEDFDKETGILHSAHVMCNAMFLTDYYKIYPQGDDRPHNYLQGPKIGLDIDGVLGDFNSHLCDYVGISRFEVTHWNCPVVKEAFDKVKRDEKFWATMPKLTESVPFETHCYITSRSIDPSITQEWLNKNGFPSAPLYCVGHNESKVEAAKQSGVEWFVDDKYENFVELNAAGICTFLFDASHNRRYDVGYKRISDLRELVSDK